MEQADTPHEIRARAVALAEYLLAVRALLDKPVRAVPTGDAFWHDDLPAHPAVELGPRQPGAGWLRVGRPAPPPPPSIPTPLLRHLVWDLTPDRPPTLQGDDEQRAAAFTRWLDEQWRPWSVAHRRAADARALHDRLYDLRYRVDVDSARVELVWGHAVLDAPLGGESVRYPLLATPVAIDYDPETTTVTVHPQGPARLQVDALGGLDNRRVGDLLDLAGPGGLVDVDPWDAAERQEFASRALRRLGFEPRLRYGTDPLDEPHVHDTGVLFLRPRQRMVRRFLEAERDRLAGSGAAGVGALAGILAHEPSALVMPDDDPDAWTRTGERLLMPMATNEAQESIAARLAAHRTVAVQGPPGTGKTHTIRNLICHLVAHGKRVLVLAQKEDPLRVLRDGLPAEIQPLCLAVLGRSADQLVQLQIAARELSDRAATLDRSAAAEELARITAEIDGAQGRFTAARDELLAVAEREATTYPIRGVPSSPAEVGEWLRRTEADGIVPDPVPPGTPAPLTAAEFGLLGDLARTLSPADRAHALADLPADGQLPTGEAVAAQRTALADAGKVLDQARDRGVDADGARRLGPTGVDELGAALRAAAETLARRAGSWTDRLGQLIREPSWQAVWDEQVAASQRLLTELGRRTAALSGHRVEIGAEHAAQPRRLLAHLTQVRERFAAGKPVRRLTHGDLAKVVADCRVDGEQPRTTDDVDLLVATVEREQLRAQLAARWAEWCVRLDAPMPGGTAGYPGVVGGGAVGGGAVGGGAVAGGPAAVEPELWAGRLLAEALDALDWDSRRWPALRANLTVLVPACPRAVDPPTLADLADLTEAAAAVFTVDRIEAEHDAMTRWLAHATAAPGAPPVLRALAAAWSAEDALAWNGALAEIRRLWSIKPDATRYAALHARLAGVAPRWAARYDRGEAPESGEAALRGWTWRQAQTWFDAVTGADGVGDDELGRRLERARDQERRLTGELVVGSAWLEVARTLDDRRKAALADWAAALRKIGKGTGKTAAHWQAAAQRAMAEAATAVPVWIMSVDRALEQFPGAGPLFDVVVVDEASQADIFALPVLGLAHRAVVVGDDQQIGPQLVGLPADRVNALIGAHLTPAGVPSAVHFDTESSLYDHAVRRSPQRILLTEHFRSVPAIIAFSSETYYDGKIQPLRADRPAGLGAAVVPIHVPDGRRVAVPEHGEVNVAEAEALVAKVTEIVADPAYRGRTIGVVSLLSTSGQADYLQHRLRAELGTDELERRSLRVGDPYTFQGDERDVVLVSTVVATADGGIGAFTKRDYHRRVNVAASRARDQLFLFHSVSAGELNPDDARGLLLSYATRPTAAPEPADGRELDTEFTREVWRRLTAAGLRPIPRFRLGAYQIDFVVNAPDGRRLAIACDDRYRGAAAFAAELRRQAVLERVGNCVFVRLRASLFHRDPDRAMETVWARAEELGLAPVRAA
ncbi:AAA domain-containing protein [Asanoa sp. WMMD1127]|uniref:AAA domain-containing protein n=1 Tax=Asanoa sp. WMMD1127 TaxID=3016107 RepID=UPI002416EB9B|nr:AAA domain-containing protein [Asanoa sp. WMMD1127]MDG4820407.1 AAA domain-containing protein [Asanoa sp. WMMD1127]